MSVSQYTRINKAIMTSLLDECLQSGRPAEDVTGDMLACVLSDDAQAQLDLALQLDQEAREPAPSNAPPAKAPAQAGEEASGSREHPPDVLPKAKARSAVFQGQLGIMDVGAVKRGNVKCFHCGTSMAVGTRRFQYAFRREKPPRSIHVDCLAAVPSGEPLTQSISRLRELLARDLPEDQDSACREALQTLRCMQEVQA